ncbi:alpha/beta hydrolase fold domain-containing protein [Photobacterium sp. DA100]|uniref:alpha/beta hydrolase fold domain-containing protein n=1 Tax=Photobacterium sp. DA100 TaxID=3027472 RepID=UPI0024795CC5|nr:alpha/beta hydrolase fold domain-containing protein [Photobacterium sp. DA100]WEM43805.1 alpha/beta hydrolase fold domain-containing protein [Photobacterium sp. DA100]
MKAKAVGTFITALALSISASIASANTALSERLIPNPVGVSEEFAKFVESKQPAKSVSSPQTTEEWIALQTQFDAAMSEVTRLGMKKHGVTFEKKSIGGVDTFLVMPKNVSPEFEGVRFVHIHGGAFVFGGGEAGLGEAAWIANGLGVEVISIDYRQPPLHPYPAALEDTVAVWKELIKTQSPNATALFGSSAGGNLTLTTTLKLQQQGLPTPGVLFAGTPATDLKYTSDTWHTLQGLDPLGAREGVIDGTFALYSNGADLAHPLMSPVYAEIKDFPPTIFISGTRDLLLSDTVRMHRVLRTANIETDLHIYDGQSHGDYVRGLNYDFPESDDALREIRMFFDKHLN